MKHFRPFRPRSPFPKAKKPSPPRWRKTAFLLGKTAKGVARVRGRVGVSLYERERERERERESIIRTNLPGWQEYYLISSDSPF